MALPSTSTKPSVVLNKSFSPSSKQIRYLNRDFDGFRDDLINFSKQYYSKTYQDFSDASPGMMFIDQAAYVGDVLSFYTDYLFKESLLNYSQERKNVVELAKYLGYTPKPTKPSVVTLDVYQIIPAVMSSSGEYYPNDRYTLKLQSGMRCVSQTGTSFITTDDVDFSVNSVGSPVEISVFSSDDDGNPTFYLLKKQVEAFSGERKVISKIVGPNEPNLRIQISDQNVIKVESVVDSDNNNWYQVDYLAQDLIVIPVENNKINFTDKFNKFSETVPNIMRLLRTDRRFVVDVDSNNFTYIQFGPSVDNTSDKLMVPNSKTIGQGFSNLDKYNISLNPSFYVNSPSYGSSPYNTTLTITYIVGGGIDANCPANSIDRVASIDFIDKLTYLPLEEALVNTIKSSVRINNPSPATGGFGEESIYEIKTNALATFSSQNRAVTSRDYESMVYSMPTEYGEISKIYVSAESSLNISDETTKKGLLDEGGNFVLDENDVKYRKADVTNVNPFGVNLYALTYDSNKNLTKINDALLYNLKNHLSRFRILSDRINVIDGYVINIGVNFSILTQPNYNKLETLDNCITAVQNFFDIDGWQFMQPINISQLQLEIANVDGVQSVANLEIVNMVSQDGSGTDYSLVEYDIVGATKNNIIYPPIDPAIFELKNPSSDIRGQIIS